MLSVLAIHRSSPRVLRVEDVQESIKLQRSRIYTILNASVALLMLMVCGCTITLLYFLNDDSPPGVLFLMMVSAFTVHGVLLVFGIILLSLVNKNNQQLNLNHKPLYRNWVFASKFTSLLIIFEFGPLFIWETESEWIKTLTFSLFGAQYLLRFRAVRKVQLYMVHLLWESAIKNSSGEPPNYDQINNVVVSSNRNATLPIDCLPGSILLPLPFTSTKSPNAPPPCYSEEMSIHHTRSSFMDNVEQPPSYQDIMKIQKQKPNDRKCWK